MSEPLAIHLYNSASRRKEIFTSLTPHTATIYACGPTVYDHIHIGNLRAYLLPDILHRLLTHQGYAVTLTINLTDFGHLTDDGDDGEDKIMRGMRREGFSITLESMQQFTGTYIDSFKADNVAFGNLPATTYARASDYIPEQIELIRKLFERGIAYETSDGVYFDVAQFPDYGKLGDIDLATLQAGARVTVNPEKKHPADFALWKKGTLGWDSQWGLGFPGWHIECAAMAFATLGEQIDIHTGGEDLLHTHHNGEIAEAEAVTGKQFVRYWLHNAFITVDQEKISKSVGNTLRLVDLVNTGYSPLDYRYWMLQSHYRTTTNFSWEALDAARTARHRLLRLFFTELQTVENGTPDTTALRLFLEALADDLDSPAALAILWEVARSDRLAAVKKATLLQMDELLNLGLHESDSKTALGRVDHAELPADIQALINDREDARATKDWATADQLRDTLIKHGFAVEDTPDGPWITRL